MASPLNHSNIVVVVAGQPRKGKSTLLNNVFGVEFSARPSPKSVTSNVSSITVTNNEVTMDIFDTPGLGSLDLSRNEKDFLSIMAEKTKKANVVLLYCHSIAVSNNLTEVDAGIIKKLHSALGSHIWQKCVLLLTFSDTAASSLFPDHASSSSAGQDYVEYVRRHTQYFLQVLKKYGGEGVPSVKCIFDYPSIDDMVTRKSTHEIVAIPVRKKKEKSYEILPGLELNTLEWYDIVLMEILQKCVEKERDLTMQFTHGEILNHTTTDLVQTTSTAAILAKALFGVRFARFSERAIDSMESSMMKLLNILKVIASKRKKR